MARSARMVALMDFMGDQSPGVSVWRKSGKPRMRGVRTPGLLKMK
jgi:hypothetical protein